MFKDGKILKDKVILQEQSLYISVRQGYTTGTISLYFSQPNVMEINRSN